MESGIHQSVGWCTLVPVNEGAQWSAAALMAKEVELQCESYITDE